MKYMLVVIITLGSSNIDKQNNFFELCIPQESIIECLKSKKTFNFTLPIISIETKCEPKTKVEKPSIKSI